MPRFYQYSAQIPVAVIFDGDAMRYESSATCIGGTRTCPVPLLRPQFPRHSPKPTDSHYTLRLIHPFCSHLSLLACPSTQVLPDVSLCIRLALYRLYICLYSNCLVLLVCIRVYVFVLRALGCVWVCGDVGVSLGVCVWVCGGECVGV